MGRDIESGIGIIEYCCSWILYIIISTIIVVILAIIYLLTVVVAEILGKYYSRFIFLIFIIIVEFTLSFFSFYLSFNKAYIIGGISAFLFIINILTLIYPYLNCCQNLRYIDNQSSEIEKKQVTNDLLNDDLNAVPVNVEENENHAIDYINNDNKNDENSKYKDHVNTPLLNDYK